LYAALDVETAYREGNQLYYHTARTPLGQLLIRAGGQRPSPVVVLAPHVRVTRLLNLLDPDTGLRLGLQNIDELLGAWKNVAAAPTQILGEAAFNDGHFEGLLYPSAQNPGHTCLVLFPARIQAPSLIDFFDPATGISARIP
jgi:RES domain-containing protein